MEFDNSRTPSFFSTALVAEDQNVFDQSFAAMVTPTGLSGKKDQHMASMQQVASCMVKSVGLGLLEPASEVTQQNSSDVKLARDSFSSKLLNEMRQRSIDPRPMTPTTQFVPGYACMNHRQITPASSTESNTPNTQLGDANHSYPLKSSQLSPRESLQSKARLEKEEHNGEAPQPKGERPVRSRKGRKRLNLTKEAANLRRDRLLERNRVAASKCRDKKKDWTLSLESRARELQVSKDSLSQLTSSLKDEVLFLKTEMLRHTDCGCNQIHDYLKCQAEILTQNDPPQPRGSLVISLSDSLMDPPRQL